MDMLLKVGVVCVIVPERVFFASVAFDCFFLFTQKALPPSSFMSSFPVSK